ncbi:MAG: hypothetical protein GEU73_03925 [Chloroflexi bacterium]|nr:hypothetical protein [Chloroflexota bacterium]
MSPHSSAALRDGPPQAEPRQRPEAKGISRWLGGLFIIAMALGGCVTPSSRQADSSDAASPEDPPKTLRIALQGFQEPKEGLISYGTAGGFGDLEHFLIFHASFTVYDPQGRLAPRLAEKAPSLQDGDWKTTADGRMEVTWRLRPDLVWHDGTPLSAEDFVFGAQVVRDPDVPTTRPVWAQLVSEVEAPDPHTLIVHWDQPSFLGGGSGASDIPALPRHLLSELYEGGDAQAFINSAYWSTEFVGLGPYQLDRWQLGSFIEGRAFADYVHGEPRIDRIVISYVGDVNAIVAGVLAGDVDAVPMGSRLDVDQVVAIRDTWGSEGGTAIVVPFGIRSIWLQFRDATAPWARDVRVRRAMVHATDRQSMSDALQYGLAPVAETFVLPDTCAQRPVEGQPCARYPFDVARAQQLLAEAGWTPGPDGVLRDPSGQLLSLDLSATGQGSNVQEIEAVASQWESAGFRVDPVPLPPQAANLDERKNAVRGGFLWPWSLSLTAPQNLVASEIATERTAWKGRNYGGFQNLAYDGLYERFATALERTERDRTETEIMRLLADEVPIIPIYYYGTGVIARKSLTGPGMISPLQTASAWNVQEWDLR